MFKKTGITTTLGVINKEKPQESKKVSDIKDIKDIKDKTDKEKQ